LKKIEKFLKMFSKPDDIWSAAGRGDMEAVKNFIAQGADVNGKQDEERYTPLHFAAKAGHLESVKELVRLGAKINARTAYGYLPIHLAIEGNAKQDLIDYFLDAGIDINKDIKGGGTILSLAALCHNEQLVQHLLSRGADPNGGADQSPMVSAASSRNIKIVDILLQAGTKVNVEPRKDSPLEIAALYGQIEMMKLLLANGANPNHRDYQNQTALMSAVMSKKIEAVQMLLEAGADVNVKSIDERTALDRAEWQKLPEIATLLKNYGAKHGNEIAESGNKDNPTTSWELLHGTVLGATLEPWPPTEGKAKLNIEITKDDYHNSFIGILEYRVTRSEKNSETWIRVFGKTDEDGNVLSCEEIILARGENSVQFRIKGKGDKDFLELENWPLKVQ
jgi:ankyrin repeat protein